MVSVQNRKLADLVESLYQGVLLSRYRDEAAAQIPIINISDLDFLHVTEGLGGIRVTLPNPNHQLREGDVVVTLRGTSLKASVVTEQAAGGVAGQNLAVLRPGPTITSLYLAVILRSRWVQAELAGHYSQSTGTQILRLSHLADLIIPVPNLDTQEKLANLFVSTEKRNRLASEEIQARNNLAEAVLIQILGEKA